MSHMCTMIPCPVCRPNAPRHAPSQFAIEDPRFNADALETVKVQPRGTFTPLPGDGPVLVYVRVADVAPALHAEIERLREALRGLLAELADFGEPIELDSLPAARAALVSEDARQ